MECKLKLTTIVKNFMFLSGILCIGLVIVAHAGYKFSIASPMSEQEPFRLGWISPLTGPLAKCGADLAARIAVEDINARGGVLGRPLELIMEDGKCNSLDAARAAQKLIFMDKVDFILGGHCSPETSAIAPIAESAKVVVLAAISSNPDLTKAGDYIFRTSASGVVTANILAELARNQLHYKSIGIISEITSYAIPAAEHMREKFQELGGERVGFETFNPGDSDFRAIITKIRSLHPEAIYIAVQSQDTANLLVSQIRQLGVTARLLANEVVGNAVTVHPESKQIFENTIFAEVDFNPDDPITKAFIEKYKANYRVEGLPYGVWTAESYDGVMLLADVINHCGPNKEEVKKCLYQVTDYRGASGLISMDKNGDGIRRFSVKQIKNGMVYPYPH